jgi:hypothetical protein
VAFFALKVDHSKSKLSDEENLDLVGEKNGSDVDEKLSFVSLPRSCQIGGKMHSHFVFAVKGKKVTAESDRNGPVNALFKCSEQALESSKADGGARIMLT